MKEILLKYLVVWVMCSVVTMLAYKRDKKAAKAHRWRTPELHLLMLGFGAGAPGALLGMKLYRHKTKHWYFWAVNMAGLLWQTGLPVVYILSQKGLLG